MPRRREPALARRRVLIVDDHPLVRRGLTALIDAEPDLVVCAEAASRREGIAAIAAMRPDLVIADLLLGDGDGLDLVDVGPVRPPVLVLTVLDAPLHVRRALAAGATGYVAKHEMTDTLLLAIRSVLRGVRYVSPQIDDRG